MFGLESLFGGGRRPAPELSERHQEALAAWRALPSADLERPHDQSRYVVVDVESSGLNMKKDRLISIGAVAVCDGLMDFSDAFQVVLRQAEVSSNENILIHGIGGSAQSEGVEPAEALLSFLNYIGKAPLVAYHAFFDQSMIEKAMKTYLGEPLAATWLDLAWILPDIFRDEGEDRLPLDNWLKRFDIENILRHNAVSDAYATAKLLQIAIAGGRRRGADTPASFVELEKSRRWVYERR